MKNTQPLCASSRLRAGLALALTPRVLVTAVPSQSLEQIPSQFDNVVLRDDIKRGMNPGHLYRIHPRRVLDYLGELWKVQWIGGSYMWGGPLSGWSFGASIAFRF